MKARQVLSDCKVAVDMASFAASHAAFRVSWAAVIVLLRTIGHVLIRVDKDHSPALARAVTDPWKVWQDDRVTHCIFWEFVEDERNNVVKEYAFGYEEDSVSITSRSADGTTTIQEAVPFRSALRTGPFAGQDGLDVARRAIEWWTRELDAIESAAGEGGA